MVSSAICFYTADDQTSNPLIHDQPKCSITHNWALGSKKRIFVMIIILQAVNFIRKQRITGTTDLVTYPP